MLLICLLCEVVFELLSQIKIFSFFIKERKGKKCEEGSGCKT